MKGLGIQETIRRQLVLIPNKALDETRYQSSPDYETIWHLA
jgi:hypothetical protein